MTNSSLMKVETRVLTRILKTGFRKINPWKKLSQNWKIRVWPGKVGVFCLSRNMKSFFFLWEGGPVPLFPWNKLACSPVPQKSKICFLMFPVLQYCLCSPIPLKIWPLFPCSPEINTLFPMFPKTPGRASLFTEVMSFILQNGNFKILVRTSCEQKRF